MRDMHAAFVLGRAAGGAFFVMPIANRLLFVVIAHRAGLGLPMSQRLGEFIRKIFYHAQQGVWRGLAEAANRRIPHQRG